MKVNLSLSFSQFSFRALKGCLFFGSAVYLLGFPAWVLQGRLLGADGLVPFEAGFSVFCSVCLFGLFVKEVWGLFKSA